MNPAEVERWALASGLPAPVLARFLDAALLTAISRLLQAVYREQYAGPSRLDRDGDGRWWLLIGPAEELRLPLKDASWHQRIEASGFPEVITAGDRHKIGTRDAFLEALRLAWRDEGRVPFDRLAADFDNSLANLLLNRVMFHLQPADAAAIEPAFQGHNSYPFPALRVGPTLAQVISCSNLSEHPVDLPLATLRGYRFASTEHEDDEAFFRRWSGATTGRWDSGEIPVHPWQIALSPLARSARILGLLRVLPHSLSVMPLASQRTCRVLATGYDIKLPVDATLTGERRLLYRMNTLNAPVVSKLAHNLRQANGPSTLDFQYDEASYIAADEHLGSHLAAIIRRPVPDSPDAVIVPALLLWTGPRLADSLLPISDKGTAAEVFLAYCRVLLRGPVEFCVQWGLALEPHLQNALIRIEGGWPTGLILRDLDGTILDPERVPALLREHSLRLPVERWDSMPDFISGVRRLMHGLLYAHLSQVALYLIENAGLEAETLSDCADRVWDELLHGHDARSRQRIAGLRAESWTVKHLLRTRMERSMALSFGYAPANPIPAGPGSG